MEETATRGAGTIAWRVHPARRRVVAALFAGTVMVVLGLLAALAMHSLWWGVFTVGFLFWALQWFFLPSEFTMDEEGLVARCGFSRRSCRWRDIRRFLHDAHGGYLSTRARGSALDTFRGVHLLFDENREAIAAQIASHVKACSPEAEVIAAGLGEVPAQPAEDHQPCSG